MRHFSSGWDTVWDTVEIRLRYGWDTVWSTVWLEYLEVLKHKESYGLCFLRLNHIKEDTKHDSLGCKTLRKKKLMY